MGGIAVASEGAGTSSPSLSDMQITSASGGGGRLGPALREIGVCEGWGCLGGVPASELEITMGSSPRALLCLAEPEESVSSMTSGLGGGRPRGNLLMETM
jgi:hypothetical protein